MTDIHNDSPKRNPHIIRAQILSGVVLGQMFISVLVTLVQQPSAVGLALLAGLPVFWGGLFGGIGGAGSLVLNGVLSILSIVYSVKGLKQIKRAEQPRRQAHRAVAVSSIATTWWAAQVSTTLMVIWVLNSVWG